MDRLNLIHGPSTQAASLDKWATWQHNELGWYIEQGRCIEIPFDDIKTWDKTQGIDSNEQWTPVGLHIAQNAPDILDAVIMYAREWLDS